MNVKQLFILSLGMTGLLINTTFAGGLNASQEEWASKIYEVESFREIFLRGSFKVYLVQDNKEFIDIRASEEEAFEYLHVTGKDGELRVHVDRRPFDFSRVSVYIHFKTLEKMDINGGMKLNTRGYLSLDDIDIRVEGGAQVDFKAKARNMGIKTEGGVLFELDGVTRSLDVHLAGAGHIDAGNLKSRDVVFRIDGVGTGRVYATHSLDARIYGAGRIRYRGNPRVTEDIEGLGSIRQE